MKAIFLKQAASIATLAIALGGAFLTDAANKAKEDADLTQGWLRVNPSDPSICNEHSMCEINNTGNVCKTGTSPTDPQLYGKFTPTGPCIRVVYRP